MTSPRAKPEDRFTFIDALRGIAAVMVLVQHLYTMGPLYKSLSTLVPHGISVVLEHGYLGVQIFFVLSGFVIAYSQRGIRVTGRFLGNFALRRCLRLDPPYYLTICFMLLADYVSNIYLTNRFVPFPGTKVVLLNMFYLQDIAGVRNIVGPSWTLCLEVQFYLTLTILVGIAQRLPYNSRPLLGWRYGSFIPLFVPLAATSLVMATLHKGASSPFFPVYWYMFFFGALIWWTIQGTVSRIWLWSYAAAIGVSLAFRWTPEMAMAIATGVVIYSASELGRLRGGLNAPVFQFFGRISYSLYLVHQTVGDRLLNIGKRLTGESVSAAVLWFTLAAALSIGTAYLVYRFVERPGVALGKRLGAKVKREIAPVCEPLPQEPAPEACAGT